MPKISVITTVYDAKEYLPLTIKRPIGILS